MSEPTKDKTDQETTSRPCPEGQEKNSEGKCVPSEPKKTADSQDDPQVVQLYKDSISKLGYKLSKENCDSLVSLKQLYEFAKANPKSENKADSDLKPPELPPAADTHKDTQERIIPPTSQVPAVNTIFKVKLDSVIPDWDKLNLDPNNDPKKVNITDKQDAALVAHMDALEQAYFNYTEDPYFEIEPSGNDDTTREKHKPAKSPNYNTPESIAKRKVDEKRVAELKKLNGGKP